MARRTDQFERLGPFGRGTGMFELTDLAMVSAPLFPGAAGAERETRNLCVGLDGPDRGHKAVDVYAVA